MLKDLEPKLEVIVPTITETMGKRNTKRQTGYDKKKDYNTTDYFPAI